MKHLPLIFALSVLSSNYLLAQCRSSRSFISIATSGNEIFTDINGRHLVGVSGITLHYGKSRASGFSYGLMYSSRKSGYATTGNVYSRSARLIGLGVQQEVLGFGRLVVSPFGNAYLGKMAETSTGNIASEASNNTPYAGAELGLELNIPVTCFLSAYGRSSVRYEQSIGANALGQTGVGTKPIAEVGIRIKV